MQARRLAKRSSLGSRRRSGQPPDGGRAPKPESGCWRPPRREGSAAALEEEEEDEDVVVEVEEEDEEDGGLGSPPAPLSIPAKGPGRGSLKACSSVKREMTFTTFQQDDLKSDISQKLPDQQFLLLTMREEDLKTADTKKPNRIYEHEKENTRSVCLLEQKRKVVSSNIDVPPARRQLKGKLLKALQTRKGKGIGRRMGSMDKLVNFLLKPYFSPIIVMKSSKLCIS